MKALKRYAGKYTDHWRRVATMMEGFGQDVPSHPTLPDYQTRKLRVMLLLEEVLELAVASGVDVSLDDGPDNRLLPELTMANLRFEPVDSFGHDEDVNPMADIADALADISVVNVGAMVAYGFPDKPLLEEVDGNNLMKIANGTTNEHGKFVKHPNHPLPNFVQVIRQL